MKILVLGNSSIFNRKVLPTLNRFKNLKIELATRRKIKSNFSYYKTYNTYSEALKKTKAEIVYISLINAKHYYWAKKSLKYKKHVLIDKPITFNSIELMDLLRIAKKKKLMVSELIVFHYHTQFKELKKKIKNNAQVKINTFFHIPMLDKLNFRNNPKLGGGCFQDMSSYAAYLIKILFDKQKFNIKNKKHSFYKGNSNSFSFEVISKNIDLNCSFSFNQSYKNYMKMKLNKKEYKINYVFSPPIDQVLYMFEKNLKSKKIIQRSYNIQNVFYEYFNMVFKIIKNKKFDFFNKELIITTNIKNEII